MPGNKRPRRHDLFLLSDSSGNLLEHFFSAVLTQFPESAFRVHTRPFLSTEEKIREALEGIDRGIICHAVADPRLKALVTLECANRKWRCADVTGPLVLFLEAAAGVQAADSPKPVHRMDTHYMGRMAALEFAMQHDDNRRIDRLSEADIVLVGISRVSKSPTALFLAYRGFKVSNVAIVPAEGLPAPLSSHRRRNVIAFTLQPRRLAEIRQRRFAGWALEEFDYGDLQSVIHEVRDAEALYKRKRWPIIDTTELAVEETATLVLKKLKLKPPEFR